MLAQYSCNIDLVESERILRARPMQHWWSNRKAAQGTPAPFVQGLCSVQNWSLLCVSLTSYGSLLLHASLVFCASLRLHVSTLVCRSRKCYDDMKNKLGGVPVGCLWNTGGGLVECECNLSAKLVDRCQCSASPLEHPWGARAQLGALVEWVNRVSEHAGCKWSISGGQVL